MGSKHTVKTVCRFCRREFDSFNLRKVCNECESRMDDQFSIIRKYINDNPNAQMSDICNALEIPPALIKFYLKEERLLIKKGKNMFLKCENCGMPLSTGKFCRECEIEEVRSEMSGKLGASVENKAMDREIAAFHIRKGNNKLLREKITK